MSLLTVMHGESGTKKGPKIIKSITNAMICCEIQKLFSWTGRAANGAKTKLAFNEYKEIIGTLHMICRRADSTYSMSQCDYDLTYRVFKHVNKKPKTKK